MKALIVIGMSLMMITPAIAGWGRPDGHRGYQDRGRGHGHGGGYHRGNPYDGIIGGIIGGFISGLIPREPPPPQPYIVVPPPQPYIVVPPGA
jgi:hypothetical protein